MCDGDARKLLVEFTLCFRYPIDSRTGSIWVELEPTPGFMYGTFEEIKAEGGGPPFYRYRDKYFRSGDAMESYVTTEMPLTIVDQMVKRQGLGL